MNAGTAAKLVKRIRKSSPELARAVDARLAGLPVKASAELLAAELDSSLASNWRQHALAAWLLSKSYAVGEGYEAAVDNAARLLANDEPESRFNEACARTYGLCVAALLIGVTIWVMIEAATGADTDESWPNFATLIFGCFVFAVPAALLVSPFVFPVSINYDLRNANTARLAISQAFERIRCKQAIGALVSASRDPDDAIRNSSTAALIGTLRRVNENDYGHLAPSVTVSLCSLLGSPNRDLVLAVLKALKLAGSGRAADPVAAIATAHADASVRAEALAALPILRERQSSEVDPALLLRAVAPDDPNPALLRPAGHQDAVRVENLLRTTIDQSLPD